MLRHLPNGKGISALGFGCSSVWSKPNFSAAEAQAMLEAAVSNGINHFDTAPSYADGEVRLGAFLSGQDRNRLVISTKVGTEHGGRQRSFDPQRMFESFAGSLRRLGTDYVDMLYLHGPEIYDLTPEVLAFFATLKAKGQIRYSGVNSFNTTILAHLVESPIDAVMLQYNFADRKSADLIDRLAAAGKIVIAGTILGQGIFNLKTFIPRDRKSLWYLLRAAKNDPLFAIKGLRFARHLGRTGKAPYEAAIHYAVSNQNITSSLFGTSNIDHLIANAKTVSAPLHSDPLQTID